MDPCATRIEVWRLDLSSNNIDVPRLRALLSGDERSRADRFVFEADRSRFICCRGALREILAKRINRKPSELSFDYNEKGKPSLRATSLEFNLSHSGTRAVLAVSDRAPVGIDIEKMRSAKHASWTQVATRFFSSREIAALTAMSEKDHEAGFFACWTRKEAYIKLHGMGLALPLNAFSVSVDPSRPAELLSTDWQPGDLSCSQLLDLDAPDGYRSCLAVRTTDPLKITVKDFF